MGLHTWSILIPRSRLIMVDIESEGKVVIVDIAGLSDQDSDGTTEVLAKRQRTLSKSNGNVSNSESR